jgi:hypothetical protein
MPEVQNGFLVRPLVGETASNLPEWQEAARKTAVPLFVSVQLIEDKGRKVEAARQERRRNGLGRQVFRGRVVRNTMTVEQIAQELLKVMLSPHTFLDVTGVEVALVKASIDRLDPMRDHTVDNSRMVFKAISTPILPMIASSSSLSSKGRACRFQDSSSRALLRTMQPLGGSESFLCSTILHKPLPRQD